MAGDGRRAKQSRARFTPGEAAICAVLQEIRDRLPPPPELCSACMGSGVAEADDTVACGLCIGRGRELSWWERWDMGELVQRVMDHPLPTHGGD